MSRSDALEQGNGAALPRLPSNRAERYAGRLLLSSLSRLPPRKCQRANFVGGVINPTGLHTPMPCANRVVVDQQHLGDGCVAHAVVQQDQRVGTARQAMRGRPSSVRSLRDSASRKPGRIMRSSRIPLSLIRKANFRILRKSGYNNLWTLKLQHYAV
jgi:hypothetical protein